MTLRANVTMVVVVLALLACGGFPTAPAVAQQAPATSFRDRVNNFFFGPATPQPGAASNEELPNCPMVDVRQGASTLPVYGPGDAASTNLRYQATIGQMARECAFLGATLTIKVGVQGRVLLGPVGAPGQLDVPLRIALVHEGPEPRTLWTKLQKIQVNIPAGQPNVTFTHIEEDVTVPKPSAGDIESYIIYVGFDQGGVKGKPAKAGKEFKERPLPSEGQRGKGKRRERR